MLRPLRSAHSFPSFLVEDRSTFYGYFINNMAISHQPAGTLQAARSRELLMSTPTQYRDALGTHVASVALIGPEEQRRKAVSSALSGSQACVTQEFTSYPGLDD